MKEGSKPVETGYGIDAVRECVADSNSRLVASGDLKQNLGLTDAQIKYALRRLEDEGILEHKDGRGVYAITGWDSRRPSTLTELELEMLESGGPGISFFAEYIKDCRRSHGKHMATKIG